MAHCSLRLQQCSSCLLRPLAPHHSQQHLLIQPQRSDPAAYLLDARRRYYHVSNDDELDAPSLLDSRRRYYHVSKEESLPTAGITATWLPTAASAGGGQTHLRPNWLLYPAA